MLFKIIGIMIGSNQANIGSNICSFTYAYFPYCLIVNPKGLKVIEVIYIKLNILRVNNADSFSDWESCSQVDF